MMQFIADRWCYFSRKYLEKGYPGCEYYSIWNFEPATAFLQNILQFYNTGLDDYWHEIDYYLLAITILALIHFGSLKFTTTPSSTLFRLVRPLESLGFDIDDRTQDRLLIAGNSLMISAWLSLLYAIVKLKTDFTAPWLLVYGFSLLCDIFYFISTGWRMGFRIVDILEIFPFMVALFNIHCVQTWRNVVERAE